MCTAPEVCNGFDDDADGDVDENLKCDETGPFEALDCSNVNSLSHPYKVELRDNYSIPGSVFSGNVYGPAIDHRWKIIANPHVAEIGLLLEPRKFRSWISFALGDFLQIASAQQTQRFTQNPLAGRRQFSVAGSAHTQGLDLWFHSDRLHAGLGFRIREATTRCGAPASSAIPPLEQSTRHDVLLVGTGDTVFFRIEGGANDIFIWADGSGPLDADLFVQAGVLPQKNQYLARSNRFGSQEGIKIPGGTSGQTFFLAVYSRSGSGLVSVRMSRSRARAQHAQTVGLAFTDATDPQFDRIKTMIRRNMVRLFAATEGQVFVKEVALYDKGLDPITGWCDCGSTPCNVCIFSRNSSFSDRANCYPKWFDPFVKRTTLYWDDTSPDKDTLAHEWGHCVLGFVDEYWEHTGCAHTDSQCLHSMMGDSSVANFCTPANHASWLDSHIGPACGVIGCSTTSCNDSSGPTSIIAANWVSLDAVNIETGVPDVSPYRDHAGIESFLSFPR